jgi:RNA polymerase sigma factor (sigma-70 family)
MQRNKDDLSDEELMTLYQSGDFTAFEILYRRHSGRVFEYLKKKVEVRTAQELLQETFEKLHRSRAKYNAQYPFLPWLFTISRNALFDFFKLSETKLAASSSSSTTLLENLVPIIAEGHSPHDISKILEVLPHHQKRAIELRYLQEWSFEKIASDMKTSEENARQMISRGIKRIRMTLSRKGEVE